MSLRVSRGFICGLICAILGLVSCSEPITHDSFVRADKAEHGVYTFDIDFSDTLSTYDIYIYSSLAGPDTPLSNVEMDLMWLSPEGKTFRETVWFREIGPRGNKELYRSGFTVSREGTWRFSVSPAAGAQKQISGIGVICINNGTR